MLLEFMPRTKKVINLTHHVANLKYKDQNMHRLVVKYRNIYKDSTSEKELIRILFTLIWLAGMHYSWWLGPGDNYLYETTTVNRAYQNEEGRGEVSRSERAHIINITIATVCE